MVRDRPLLRRGVAKVGKAFAHEVTPMNLLQPMRRSCICPGVCLLGVALSCSSVSGKSAPDGPMAGNGGHGAAEADAATGVAAANSPGTGGSAGRGSAGTGTTGG